MKLTAQDVAERLGVHRDSVYSWEYDTYSPATRHLPKIIEFLGYDPGMVITRICGDQIISYRRLHKLSQKILAPQLGVTVAALRRWEKNERRPPERLFQRLLGVLVLSSSSSQMS